MSWEALGLACLGATTVFVGIPVLIYLCAKFGTFGVLKAKDQFNKEKERQNGDEST
jgi:hypothetical protein